MPTQAEWSDQIRRAIALTDPDLDTTVGTTPRKMIDSFAEGLAEASLDANLSSYQYDVDARSGSALDAMLSGFGFPRLAARRATGVVVFERTSPATQNILIPAGTQVATNDPVPTVVATVIPATIDIGDTSIEVPVQAIEGGSRGNAQADSLNRWIRPIQGISGVTNPAALTGGTDVESDPQYRLRWRRTGFRNMAGTEPMFLGVALEDPDVTQANVVGAAKRWREQIQLVGGTATSGVQSAAYLYPDNAFFGPSLDDGDILIPEVHYHFNATVNPPTVTSLDATTVPDGVYDLEFGYLPTASRNQPASGITNRIDIYVDGVRVAEAIETTIFRTAKAFNNTVGDALNRTNFEREDGSTPVAGNILVPVGFNPIVDASPTNQIVVGGVTYIEGTDYYRINNITNVGGMFTSLSGIEWRTTANGAPHAPPADGTAITLDYLFNAVPRDIQAAIESWRLTTVDVKVHQARLVRLNLNLAVILRPGVQLAGVQTDLFNRLQQRIASVGFDGVVQVSDLLSVASQIDSIDAVRFLTSSDDAALYAIQQVATNGTTLLATFDNGGAPKRAIDVRMTDDKLPVLNAVRVIVKAQNTFGAV